MFPKTAVLTDVYVHLFVDVSPSLVDGREDKLQYCTNKAADSLYSS